MRTRSKVLLGGLFVAAAAVALISSATASGFVLDLNSPDTQWPISTDANLDVSVDPALIGGYGRLFRTIEGQTTFVKEFNFTDASFSITAPIPNDPSIAGKMCGFKYVAFEAGGTPVGTSPIEKKPVPPIDIE
jgi:hypothetical protein